ncbi:hypothetical protein KP509_30G007400 [Ceratopteris richardii]|uniref:glutathione transferase n=1 Tax=Ceratopteris richardii TaxID=49495 RepID=A0A8T2R113_CERRI|nr:hypothetical protein KP509_30G007300 [Ceratopteris richardii]KAH7289524.1 hypothetical protein KP509_30G007400 [Ceratopteris richardii]
MAEVQLLSAWASPFVMRAEVALALKGVQYEKVPQDLGDKSELLLKSNPVYKKVPVLLHNGKSICESSIIAQYVDEAWPAPKDGVDLLPSDPYGKAMTRFWADYVDKKVFDGMFGLLRSARKSEEEKKAALENIVSAMQTLESGLAEIGGSGPFFGGGSMGLVDVMLLPLLAWLPAIEELVGLQIPFAERFPRLEAWFAASQRHDVASLLPSSTKISEFITQAILPRLSS